MRSVFVGTDLMYGADGKIHPIEINTNVGADGVYRVESMAEVLDFQENLLPFIDRYQITKIMSEGMFWRQVIPYLQEIRPDLQYEEANLEGGIEEEVKWDDEHTLFIRTSYSDEALVDSFCRDKIAFLECLEGTEIEVPAIVKDEEGIREIGVMSLPDNEHMPNCILKYRYPHYDRDNYPRCFRFGSKEQLETFVSSSEMLENYHLVPYMYSSNHLFDSSRVRMIRNWSIFVVDSDTGKLTAMSIGNYSKIAAEVSVEEVEHSWTSEGKCSLPREGREQFIVDRWAGEEVSDLYLDRDDLVWMADGTWKRIGDFNGTEEVRTIHVTGDDLRHTGDVGKSFGEWSEESAYTAALIDKIVTRKGFQEIIKITFTDGTDWEDLQGSSYPTIRVEDQHVVFKLLSNLVPGDKVVLVSIECERESPSYMVKEIQSISIERKLVEGFGISLIGNHIFVTRTIQDNVAYASIEHNTKLESWCGSNPAQVLQSYIPGTDVYCEGGLGICTGGKARYDCDINIYNSECPAGSCNYALSGTWLEFTLWDNRTGGILNDTYLPGPDSSGTTWDDLDTDRFHIYIWEGRAGVQPTINNIVKITSMDYVSNMHTFVLNVRDVLSYTSISHVKITIYQGSKGYRSGTSWVSLGNPVFAVQAEPITQLPRIVPVQSVL